MRKRIGPVWSLALLLGLSVPSLAHAKDHSVHLWLRAFIPKPASPVPPYYKQAVDGRWLIEAPSGLGLAGVIGLPAGCFSTDNRGFDTGDSPAISARVTFEVDVVTGNGEMKLVKHAGRDLQRVGVTRNVNCTSGVDLQPPRQAPASSVVVGSVRTGTDGQRKVVNVKGTTGDPFYQIAGLPFAPRLDFEMVVTFDPAMKRLEIQGVSGTFPAFEVYYQVDGGPTQRIIQWSPTPGAGAASLADVWLGLNSRNFNQNIPLP